MNNQRQPTRPPSYEAILNSAPRVDDQFVQLSLASRIRELLSFITMVYDSAAPNMKQAVRSLNVVNTTIYDLLAPFSIVPNTDFVFSMLKKKFDIADGFVFTQWDEPLINLIEWLVAYRRVSVGRAVAEKHFGVDIGVGERAAISILSGNGEKHSLDGVVLVAPCVNHEINAAVVSAIAASSKQTSSSTNLSSCVTAGSQPDLNDRARRTWNTVYPDRKKWDELGQGARDEWIKVFATWEGLA